MDKTWKDKLKKKAILASYIKTIRKGYPDKDSYGDFVKLSDAEALIERLLKEQKGMCADRYHADTWIEYLSSETYNKILKTPDATGKNRWD